LSSRPRRIAPAQVLLVRRPQKRQKNLRPKKLIEKILPPTTQPTEPQAASVDSGSIIVANEGILYSPTTTVRTTSFSPRRSSNDYKPPAETLPRIGGGDEQHKVEWIAAIKGGPKAMSNFDYAGLLAETILLGNVAIRGQRPQAPVGTARVQDQATMPRPMNGSRRKYSTGWCWKT